MDNVILEALRWQRFENPTRLFHHRTPLEVRRDLLKQPRIRAVQRS
jgi:hypothetical protein